MLRRTVLVGITCAGLLGACVGTLDNCPTGLDPPPRQYGSILPDDPGAVKPLP